MLKADLGPPVSWINSIDDIPPCHLRHPASFLCFPLLLLPLIFPAVMVFSNASHLIKCLSASYSCIAYCFTFIIDFSRPSLLVAVGVHLYYSAHQFTSTEPAAAAATKINNAVDSGDDGAVPSRLDLRVGKILTVSQVSGNTFRTSIYITCQYSVVVDTA